MIAVTGASGQVGTLLRERLAERGGEVVPLDQGEDWAAGIAGAEVVVHLAGTLQPKGRNSYRAANVETSAAVAAAARAADVRRIVFLSYVGADPDSGNAYLRSKAEAEKLLFDSGVPTTVFRCLHIFGTPARPGPTAGAFLAKGRRPVLVPGSGAQRIEPLYVGDVVSAVEAAATRAEAPTGSIDLGGPEQMSMDGFARALNGAGARLRHLPAGLARLSARLSPSLTPALMDLLLRDNVTATPAAEVGERFGFTPHRVADVWGRAS
ncbi:MAG: NAD-dependent epimerase/dehydratase family protein [Solirubrobacterales bacterium]